MTIAQKLKKISEKIIFDAENISKDLERYPPSHKAPPDQLKVYNAEREAAAKSLSRIHGRLPYIVKGRTDYNCPQCWFFGDNRSIINPKPGKGTTDYWRCDMCNLEVTVERSV